MNHRVIALLAFATLACRKAPREGFIDGLVAIDARGAILLWGSRGDGAPTSWVSRVDDHGDTTWVQPIPAAAMSIGGTGGVTIVDGVVVVRYSHRSDDRGPIDNAAIAFDIGDGRVLWDHVLAPYRGEKPISSQLMFPSYVSDFAIGEHIVSFVASGEGTLATSTVARTGAVAWTHPAASGRSPVVFGESYAIHDADRLTVTSAATGEELGTNGRGTGCALGKDYLAIALGANDGAKLVSYASPKAEPRVIAPSFAALSPHALVLACGHHGDNLVFLTEEIADAIRNELIITDRDGVLLHRIALGAGPQLMSEALDTDPAHATAGGELPRFMLYPDKSTLVMIDLETGELAWRGAPDKELLHGALFHIGTRWIWSDSSARTIAVFDGTTGKLTAAIEASGGALTSRNATPDTLWLSGGGKATADDAAIANLDLATLKPRFARVISVTDATAKVRAKLGI